jgi:hypothetical protein
MCLHGFGESRRDALFDRRHIDAQQYPGGRRMLASFANQGLGKGQCRPDRDVQRLDERQRDGNRDHRRRRDRSADALSFTDHADDPMLEDDAVEPPPSDTERVCDDNAAVCSQIIPDTNDSFMMAPVCRKTIDRADHRESGIATQRSEVGGDSRNKLSINGLASRFG